MPWWLGLPLLLAIVAALLIPTQRLVAQASVLRRALRWGLPGMLLALQRGLGGDALAWSAALLGALAGFTLLAGLEAWLDRAIRRLPAAASSPIPDWPELALAPIGPAVAIIELHPPQWLRLDGDVTDSRGGIVRWHADAAAGGRFQFADGTLLEAGASQCSFSPDGRWFATHPASGRGIVLLDRDTGQLHRLRGWQLCGWHTAQPWLMRGEHEAPATLSDALGEANAR